MKYLLLALALLTSACGKDDSKSDTAAAGPNATAAPAVVSELEGVWSSDCLPVMPTLSFKAVRTVAGNTAKSEVFAYADGFCSASALRVVTVNTDTFRIGAAVTSPAGAKKIDYTVVSVTKTYKEKANADDAATANDYGYSDWKAEVAKDIAGKRRQPNDDPEDHVGQVLYSIFKIDGKKLYGGDYATGKETSDGTRPTDLSTTAFTKQ